MKCSKETNKDNRRIHQTKKTPIYKCKEVGLSTSHNPLHKPNQLLAQGYFIVMNLCSYSAPPASSSSTSRFRPPAAQMINHQQNDDLLEPKIRLYITNDSYAFKAMILTSINLVISCTFSLFLSLKASRASLYSFSCDKFINPNSVLLIYISHTNQSKMFKILVLVKFHLLLASMP